MATEKELNIILKARDEASKVLKDVRTGADQWGKALTAAGVAGATAFAAATNVAADFEQGLSNVKAVSGATAGEMKVLHDLALQLGKDTSFSAREAVNGMEELIKAGLTPAQVQAGALKGALDLAAAGEIDLASAAEIAATAVNTFKLKGEDMTHVANLLAGAANASATDVGELKFAIAQSGLVAAQVGVSIDDLTTTLGVFANNGLKGSDAGTSLKTMLMRLVPTTKEATNMMRDLGMITKDGKNTFYDAAGNLKSMSEVAGILQASTKKLTAEEKQFFLGQIFGQDAIRAVNALLSAGKDGFNDMAVAIGKVTAADVAAEKLNNLKGGLEQLKGSVETIAIVVGERFLPYVRKATTWITNLANKFLELDPGVQDMIVKAAALATGFALIAGPVLLLISKLGAIGGALGALAGPVGLVIAGLALLYAAFVNNWGGIRDVAIQAGTDIMAWFQTNWPMIRDTVVAVFQETMAILGPVLAGFLQLAVQVGTEIVAWFKANWPAIRDTVVDTFQVLKEILPPILTAITEIITATFNAVGPIIQAAMAISKQVFDATWPRMLEIVKWFVDRILPWIVDTFQKISDWIGEIMPYIQQIIDGVLVPILENWQATWEVFWPIVQAVFEVVKAVISVALDFIMGAIKLFLQLVTGDWAGAWETIKQTSARITAGIHEVIMAALNLLWTTLNQLLAGWPQKIFDTLVAVWAYMSSLWAKVKEITITAITEVATWINDSLGGWPKRIYDALVGIWQSFTDIWQGVKDQSLQFLNEVWKAIWAQLTSWTQKAKAWAKSFVDTIKKALSFGKGSLSDAAAGAAQGVADNLELHSPAKKGPLATLDTWWKPLVDTLLGDHLNGTAQPAAQLAGETMTGLALSGSPVANGAGARGPFIVQNYIQSQPTWNMEDVRKHVEQATIDALVRMGLA